MIRTLLVASASLLILSACQQQPASTPDSSAQSASSEQVQMAPEFTLVDAEGVERTLSDFRGKTVVLEWTNEGCPYVKKHYTGAMQALQRRAIEGGAVWLTIISSEPGAQGYVEGEAARAWGERNSAAATHLLLDPTGVVGQSYGAVTTPDMRVIDEEGRIIFTGGIDDRPSSDLASLDGATNHVQAALDDHAAGRPVAVSFAQPYGCSIKYPGAT
jgi:hypothetical protein